MIRDGKCLAGNQAVVASGMQIIAGITCVEYLCLASGNNGEPPLMERSPVNPYCVKGRTLLRGHEEWV